MKRKKKRLLIWGIILLVIIIIVVVVGVMQSKKKLPGTIVTVELAEVRRIVSTVSANGSVEPVQSVKVSAEIPGRIVQLPVKEGQYVEKSRFLVELDPETYKSSLEAATSALRSARAQKEKSEADLRRTRELLEKGMASQADLDAAVAASELYAGELESAFAREKTARENLAKTQIHSPMSGTISRLNKEVGELTLGSQFQEDVILEVADLTRMQVRSEVDENDIVAVKIGDSAFVEIDAFPDTVFLGAVSEIAQSASATGVSSEDLAIIFDVLVALEDSIRGLRPGMSATVDIATDFRDDALSVSLQCVAVRDKEQGKAVELQPEQEPKSSRQIAEEVRSGTADTSRFMSRDELQEGVFVFAGDSAVWKPVKTGISSDRHIVIESGIEAGDSVISGPYRVLARDLTDGAKVRLKEEGKKKESGEPAAENSENSQP